MDFCHHELNTSQKQPLRKTRERSLNSDLSGFRDFFLNYNAFSIMEAPLFNFTQGLITPQLVEDHAGFLKGCGAVHFLCLIKEDHEYAGV